eukprot:4457052-Prymnesium_polylepis.1
MTRRFLGPLGVPNRQASVEFELACGSSPRSGGSRTRRDAVSRMDDWTVGMHVKQEATVRCRGGLSLRARGSNAFSRCRLRRSSPEHTKPVDQLLTQVFSTIRNVSIRYEIDTIRNTYET